MAMVNSLTSCTNPAMYMYIFVLVYSTEIYPMQMSSLLFAMYHMIDCHVLLVVLVFLQYHTVCGGCPGIDVHMVKMPVFVHLPHYIKFLLTISEGLENSGNITPQKSLRSESLAQCNFVSKRIAWSRI